MNHFQSVNPVQILLLKAALFPANEALIYWEKWRSLHHLTDDKVLDNEQALPPVFKTLDAGSYRLMPLIYRNLEQTSDLLVPHLKSIYRNTWMKNQFVLKKVREAVAALQNAGIETMLLKGLCMALIYYKDLGVRPTADGDVMVHTKDVKQAIAVLKKQPYNYDILSFNNAMSDYIHAAHLFDQDNFDFDIHWHLLFLNRTAEADAPFWAAKNKFNFPNGLTTNVLSPTHQVLHNLVHGNFPDVAAPIRWVADCYVICQNHEIDWLEILKIAEEKRMLVPVLEGIALLRSEFKLILKPEVAAQINQLKPNPIEASYHDFLKKNVHKKSGLKKAIKFYRKASFEYDLYHADYLKIPYLAYLGQKMSARSYAHLTQS
jgi:hydroxymethylpyrimidine pyrophosphatase-like HAD family hydrolase